MKTWKNFILNIGRGVGRVQKSRCMAAWHPPGGVWGGGGVLYPPMGRRQAIIYSIIHYVSSYRLSAVSSIIWSTIYHLFYYLLSTLFLTIISLYWEKISLPSHQKWRRMTCCCFQALEDLSLPRGRQQALNILSSPGGTSRQGFEIWRLGKVHLAPKNGRWRLGDLLAIFFVHLAFFATL